MNNHYAASGVNIHAGYEAVDLIKEDVRSTYTKGVLGALGSFSGIFEPDMSGMKRPVLVSGTDGVGTKLKLAFLADKHDTVGIDCVAMCVNDVACAGALPLFFLDYIACGKNLPQRIAEIVSGVAEGCRQCGAALIGGETAEMPGFYPDNEYDLAGFCVGMADYDSIIDGRSIKPGDILVGLPSSGVHSNGFSLIRRIYPKPNPELIAELLTPTKIYVHELSELRKNALVKGVAHITGGGWIENIPRILPKGLSAVMNKPAVPEIFRKIQIDGGIDDDCMYNTFNMGYGMVVCLPPAHVGDLQVLGRIEEGGRGIVLS